MVWKRKVLAYITNGEHELLVFEHKDHPEAGIQVPGGTIEDDELLIDALFREIKEESGLGFEQLLFLGKVSKSNYYPEGTTDVIYERNYFHLAYVGDEKLDEWENKVSSDGKDNGLVFSFRWVPISRIPDLAVKQDEAIELLDFDEVS